MCRIQGYFWTQISNLSFVLCLFAPMPHILNLILAMFRLSGQKNVYLCFIDYAKAFDYVDHNKLWKILKEMGIPNTHLTCLLRNL